MDVFTTAQWRAGGRSVGSLTRAVADGRVRPVLHGVCAWSGVPDTPEHRARAIMLVRPRQTVIGRAMAAWLAGVDVLPPGRRVADQTIDLVVAKDVVPPRLPGAVPSGPTCRSATWSRSTASCAPATCARPSTWGGSRRDLRPSPPSTRS
jgi:hypothetical protein